MTEAWILWTCRLNVYINFNRDDDIIDFNGNLEPQTTVCYSSSYGILS